ncbi:MAG: FtsX-like permease family protein [Spirochaetales bacterium]
MILKLALRNLYRHPRQTLTVGGVLMMGIALLFVGNALFDGTEAGIEESFIASFTAHLSVRARSVMEFSIFGDQTPVIGELFRMPTLAPYTELRKTLEQQPGVEAVTSLVSGLALLEYGNYRMPAPLFGVEPDTYLKVMPGITVTQGRFLQPGERGVVLPEARIRQIEATVGKKLNLGEILQFAVADGISFRIRSAPLLGVIRYPLRNETLDSIVLIDPTSLRELYSYFIGTVPAPMNESLALKPSPASSPAFSPPTAAPAYPDTPSISSRSSNSQPLSSAPPAKAAIRTQPAPATAQNLLESLFENPEPDQEASVEGIDRQVLEQELAQALQAPRPAVDEGAWNFILLRLKPEASVARVHRTLQRLVQEKGWEIQVLDWRQTAGASALFLYWMRLIFNIGFGVVAITSLIILMDSLVMNVLERVPEIGTLRALGASPSVIRRLFLTETTLLAAGAGLLGIGLGLAAGVYLRAHPIQLENEFLIQLFGGNSLFPRLSLNRVVVSWIVALILGLVGWIYPVRIALKVQPRVAMERRL